MEFLVPLLVTLLVVFLLGVVVLNLDWLALAMPLWPRWLWPKGQLLDYLEEEDPRVGEYWRRPHLNWRGVAGPLGVALLFTGLVALGG